MRAIAVRDRLVAERDRAQARAAHLLTDQAGVSSGTPGIDRRLARRVLALRRGQDLAEDDFGDVLPASLWRASARP